MSPQPSWIIGSDPSCDILVEEPTVSGRHCCIRPASSGYTIEDLQSTNGVFVNGRRLASVVGITPKDRVTLGEAVPLPWERIEQLASKKTIRVGRAPDNDVVLDYPNVSAHHARIAIDANGMVIEDLGATNGIAVNSAENIVTRATIHEEDTVYFGSTAIPVSKLLRDLSAEEGSAGQVEPSHRINLPIPLLAAAALVVVILPLGYLLLRGGSPQDTDETSGGGPAAIESQIASSATSSDRADSAGAVSDELDLLNETDGTATQEKQALPASGSPQRDALFWVVVGNAAGDQTFRVGTAWAVDRNSLVTTASVVKAMEDLKRDQYPRAWAFSPASQAKLMITASRIHDSFQEAFSSGRNAQREYEQMWGKLQSQTAEGEDLKTAREALVEFRHRAFEAFERQVYFDVGVLDTDLPIEARLELAPRTSSLRPKLKVRVFGPAFDKEDPFFDAQAVFDLPALNTRVNKLVRFDSTQIEVQRLLVDCDPQQLELNLAGCPLVNARGQVVAIYSRPTPPETGDQPPTGETFDAVLADRVRELLPSIP